MLNTSNEILNENKSINFFDSTTSLSAAAAAAAAAAQRQKRMRTSFKHHQLRVMKSYFEINHNPDAKDLKQLSQKTGLSKRVLQVWFQNARAKYRRTQTNSDCPGSLAHQCDGDILASSLAHNQSQQHHQQQQIDTQSSNSSSNSSSNNLILSMNLDDLHKHEFDNCLLDESSNSDDFTKNSHTTYHHQQHQHHLTLLQPPLTLSTQNYQHQQP